jgi:hypothetical protein
LPVITTKKALADAIGVHRRSLTNYLKRDDWPVSRDGPWNGHAVNRIKRWRRDELQEDRSGKAKPIVIEQGPADEDDHDDSTGDAADKSAADGNRDRGWNDLYKEEQTLLTRVKRELLEGKYIETSIHEQALLALADTFIECLSSLSLSLPLALEGLDAGERERVITERFTEARHRIADKATSEQANSKAQAKDTLPRAGKGRPARGAKRQAKKKKRAR